MPVFYGQGKRILYIHVPKTAGTAIELFFEKNGFNTAYLDRGQIMTDSLNEVRKCSPQHMEADLLTRLFRVSSFDYVFMTVRHPVARIISEYKMHASQLVNVPDVNTWTEIALRRYQEDPYVFDNHIRPQSEFLVSGCDVFKQEDGFGTSWLQRIASRIPIQIRATTVDVAMRFDANTLAQPILSKDSLAALDKFYHRDLEVFEYR